MPTSAETSQVKSVSKRSALDFDFDEAGDLKKRSIRENRLWLLAFLGLLLFSSLAIYYLGTQDAKAEKTRTSSMETKRLPTFESPKQDRAAEAINAELNQLGLVGATVRFVQPDQLEVEIRRDVDRAIVPIAIRRIKKVAESHVGQSVAIAVYFANTPGEGRRIPAAIE